MSSYLPLLLLFLIAAVIAVAMFTLTTVLGPKNPPNPANQMPFECGNESTGSRFVRPSVKFYLTAILFVVFDIEVVLMYPWVVSFRALGWMGFTTMVSFVALLVVALLYVWKKGALEWEK